MTSMKAYHLLIIGLLFSHFSRSASTVPLCDRKPDFATRTGASLSLKSLPPMVLIGKKADYYVENKTSGLRLWGSQSFKKGDSKIICATSGKEKTESFSLYAPTLIDFTGSKSVGDSYWQFHMIANPNQFGIWNQKSHLFSKAKDLESALAKIGARVQILQHANDEYELILTRENDHLNEVLSIRFDAVSALK